MHISQLRPPGLIYECKRPAFKIIWGKSFDSPRQFVQGQTFFNTLRMVAVGQMKVDGISNLPQKSLNAGLFYTPEPVNGITLTSLQ